MMYEKERTVKDEITVEEVARMKSNLILIDVRETWKRDICKISGECIYQFRSSSQEI